MQSKSSSLTKDSFSFFQKPLFFNNLTRFWPIQAIIFILLFFCFPMTILVNDSRDLSYLSFSEIKDLYISHLIEGVSFYQAMLFILGAACALCVFFYQYHENSYAMFHSFPMKKGTLFVTNYLSGLTFLLAPHIVIMAIVMMLSPVHHIEMKYICFSFVSLGAIAIFYYSLAVFCCILSGYAAIMPVYYMVLNFLGLFFSIFISPIVKVLLYGYPDVINFGDLSYLSPPVLISERVYLSHDDNAPGITHSSYSFLLILFLIAIAIFIVTLFLYKNKKVESAGETMTFKKLYPVFTIIFMICFSLALTTTIVSFNFAFNTVTVLISLLLSGLIAYFISRMILLKSFRVFQGKPVIYGVYSVICILFCMACSFDLTGYSGRQPAISQISKAAVSYNYFSNSLFSTDNPENMEKILKLQNYFIHNRSIIESDYHDFYSCDIIFSYKLKDGTIMTRSYPVSEDIMYDESSKTRDEILDFYTDKEVLTEIYLPKPAGELYSVNFTALHDFKDAAPDGGYTVSEEERTLSSTGDEEKRRQIYEAVKKDILNGSIHPADSIYDNGQSYYMNSFSFSFSAQKSDISFDPYLKTWTTWTENTYEDGSGCIYIRLNKNCTNTIQALLATGILASEDELLTDPYET